MGIYRENGKENGGYYLGFRVPVGGLPHPVMVTKSHNSAATRALLLSYNATITGWGVLQTQTPETCLLKHLAPRESIRTRGGKGGCELGSWA